MRAIRFHELGGPEVLRYEEVSEPQLDDTQVLIKVAAAGVNYSDLGRRKGSYAIPQPLPTVLGLEVAGTVSHVGAEVTDFVPGQRVMAWVGGGGYAEYAKAPVEAVYAIPDTLGFEAAAGMPVVFLTGRTISSKPALASSRMSLSLSRLGRVELARLLCSWQSCGVHGFLQPLLRKKNSSVSASWGWRRSLIIPRRTLCLKSCG